MIRIILTTLVFGVLLTLQYRFIGSESNWTVPSVIGVIVVTFTVAVLPSKKSKQNPVLNANDPSQSTNQDPLELRRRMYQEADGPNYDSAEWHR